MTPHLSSLMLGIGFAATTAVPSFAYPVDCAILLCLAGGWPASVECAEARTVFIARITPWPIEPPLQLWNCPLHASADRPGQMAPLLEISARRPPALTLSEPGGNAPLTQAVSGPGGTDATVYGVVQSIRVFQTEFRQTRTHDDNCTTSATVHIGRYDQRGDFAWESGAITDLPAASKFKKPSWCGDMAYRSVFVDWRDALGSYGFEEVRY